MAREAKPINLSEAEKQQLQDLIRKTSSKRISRRAEVILRAGEGEKNNEIATALQMTPKQVSVWRKRYLESGINGLADAGPRGAHQLEDKHSAETAEKNSESRETLTTSWTVETTDPAVKEGTFPLYLYITSSVQIAFLAIHPFPNRTGHGELITHNSLLARDLEKAEAGFADSLRLDEILLAAAEHCKDKRTIVNFVRPLEDLKRIEADCMADNPYIPVTTVIHGMDYSGSLRPVQRADDAEAWLQILKGYCPVFSDKEEKALRRLCSGGCEPFVWERKNEKISADERAAIEVALDPVATAFRELEQSEGMQTGEGEFSYGMITVVKDAQGNLHTRVISDPSARQNESTYDVRSIEGIRAGINVTEQKLIRLRNAAGAAILEDVNNNVKKKEKLILGNVRCVIYKTETGDISVPVPGDAARTLQSREKVRTAGIALLESILAKEDSFNESADLYNFIDHLIDDGSGSRMLSMTLHNQVERDAMTEIYQPQQREVGAYLQKLERYGMNPETGIIAQDSLLAHWLEFFHKRHAPIRTYTVYPDYAVQKSITEWPKKYISRWEAERFPVTAYLQKGYAKRKMRRSSQKKPKKVRNAELVAKARSFPTWVNSHYLSRVNRMLHPCTVEVDPDETCSISIDEVLVKRQKSERGDSVSETVSDRSYVSITNIAVTTSEGSYAITGQNNTDAMRQLMAFLLKTGLISRYLLFFVDGEATLFDLIDTYFFFCRRRVYLDWFHLDEKFTNRMSRAIKPVRMLDPSEKVVYYLKGTKKGQINRKASKYTSLSVLYRRNAKAIAWAGNFQELKDYLRSIPKDDLKKGGKEEIDLLISYIDRKAEYLTCYALRKYLGLHNTSNAVENLNQQLVSRREKLPWMSWSDSGSFAIAVIRCAAFNQTLEKYYRHEKVEYTLIDHSCPEETPEEVQAALMAA